MCRRERKKYQSHREKARSAPHKSCTIIVDGMDQAKTNIPYTKLQAKSASNLWKLRTHVTGVLVHTKSPYGKIAYAFVDLLEYPHDSNLTITILMNVLVHYLSTHPILPETLYIQLDNTSRENKNRYVFGFCSLLVELRIFKKVRLYPAHLELICL